MGDKRSQKYRFHWQLPLLAVVGSFTIFFPLIMWTADFGEILYLLIAALISLVFVALTVGRRGERLTMFVTLIVFLACSWVLAKNNFLVRSEGRWILASNIYRKDVLAQPLTDTGELRHIEWDGWGFPGAGNTIAYLVFDPTDTVATEIKRRSSGKFSGIPCEVYQAHRLEQHWYYMLFYTDTVWENCSP